MGETHDITLREVAGPTPPNIISDLVAAVHELIPDAATSASTWFRGRAAQQTAKAGAIKAQILATIGAIDLDRQRLVQERDAAAASARNDSEKAHLAHRERMYELKTQRFREVVDAIRVFAQLGVPIEIDFLAALQPIIADVKSPETGTLEQ